MDSTHLDSLSLSLFLSRGELRYLSTIPLKNLHLFKITESIISLCFKNFSDLAILNMWESFSEMVDHVSFLS